MYQCPDAVIDELQDDVDRLEAENKLLREAIRLMHHAKSKSEYKRLCNQAGIDWAELVREEK